MRRISMFFIVLALFLALFVASCDTGEVCDAQGNCESAAQEDRATLKPNITDEIRMAQVGIERP